MFPITITINNHGELQRVLEALKPETPAPVEKPAEEPKKAPKPPKPTEAPKAEAAKQEPAVTPPTVAEPAASEPKAEPSAEKAEPAEIDFTTQIQAPIVRMAGPLGMRDQAVKILSSFGVKKASEIQKSDYAKAAAMIAEALPK